ncbi:M67 family metallopeptidase [Paenibacillus soyae]|uniref:M67 family metallopeptidase n=1 Tax=Paenibacillus soyae TaxID=2969249 RepID=A0A9X2S7E9_9BACL|nr:M67 family metallopeptidase [Paenibacillus soyae]MCR2803239.1 M67 family metallopeptidase [Paenibacillus soyae]
MTSGNVFSTINQMAYTNLIDICRQRYPQEACGVLARSEGSQAIDIVIPIANGHANPIRSFSFDPEQWTAAFFSMQKNRHQLVGFFHSHPASEPHPSLRDTDGFLPQSELSYWIVSLLDWNHPIVQPYLRSEGRPFAPLPLVLA